MEFPHVRRRLQPRARIAGGTAVLGAAATVMALIAVPAQAFHDQGRPWPGHVITYHNDFPADALAVRAAVHDWNTSGAAVRLESVPAAQAEVTILSMPAVPLSSVEKTKGGGSADALGFASVGQLPRNAELRGPSGQIVYGAHVWLARIGSRDSFGVQLSLGTMERVAAHEFGHILGLGHEHKACAVMQPILDEGCGIKHPWIGLCNDPLEPDDVRGAVSLYGGHEPRFRKRLCVISPVPQTTSRLSARLIDHNAKNVIRWKNPRGVTFRIGHYIDPYVLNGRSTIEEYEIQGSRQGCPRGKRDLLERELAHANTWKSVSLPLPPGSWCLQVRVLDWFGRIGPIATVKVVVPELGQASPPVPNFQLSPVRPRHRQKVHFINDSTAGAAAIAGWSWNFGDGTSSTAAHPQHRYAKPGRYRVTLRATDTTGHAATVTETVRVT